MRRAGTVIVSGAVLLALLCIAFAILLADPAGAQQSADPLEDQTVNIVDADGNGVPDSAGPIAVAGCQATAGETASITVTDLNGTEEVFTDDDGVVFDFGPQGITITADGGGDLDVAADFEPGTGSVVSSEGITCDDGNPPPNNGEQPQGGSCANPQEVASIGPTTDNTERQNVRISGETFRVTYDVEVLDRNEFSFVTIDIRGRFGAGPLVFVEETESDSFIVTESPGNFDIIVEVDEPNSARYTLTVENCGSDDGDANGGDGNNGGGDDNNGGGDGADDEQYDDGDVDDPDDVVPGTGDDDPLPDTGGTPLLLGAAALVLAAALLARRVLAP